MAKPWQNAWKEWKTAQEKAEVVRDVKLTALYRSHQKEERAVWREYYAAIAAASAARNTVLDRHPERMVKVG